MEETVLFTKRDGVALVTMNRPAAYNALNLALMRALVEAFQRTADDPGVRAVVLTGSGAAFCAGGDMKEAGDRLAVGAPAHFRELTKFLHRLVSDLRLLPKPVVAAVNGPAAGAGFSLAMACDLRIMSDKGSFKQAYTSIGLCPDGGWSLTVPTAIGLARASELVFLDQKLPAQQCLEWGLVTRVVPHDLVMDEAMAMAKRLADGPLASFARAKELLNASLYGRLASHLELERQALMRSAGTPYFAEGAAAFTAKRDPDYSTIDVKER